MPKGVYNRNNTKLEEILRDNPEIRKAYENRVYRIEGSYKISYIQIKCPVCGKVSWKRWYDIYTALKKGKIRACSRECMAKVLSDFYKNNSEARKNLSVKGREYWETHPEEAKKRNKKTQTYYKEHPEEHLKRLEGLYTPETNKKRYEATSKYNKFMQSEWEHMINDMYCGEHKPCGSEIYGVVIPYELDCYFSDVNLAIEIDDLSHREGLKKEKGYHRAKDEWFMKHLGIKILHLTTNKSAPHRFPCSADEMIRRFRYYGDMSVSMIDLNDEYYGDIWY